MRKLLTKFALIATSVFVLMLILYEIALRTDNGQFIKVSKALLNLGVPLFSVILVAVALIMIITGKTLDQSQEEKRKNEDEANEIQGINSSKGYENRYREAEYIGYHAARNYKNSSAKERILAWSFLGFLVSVIMLSLVFLYFHIAVGFIVCWCVFVGTILISGIVQVVLHKVSMNAAKKSIKDDKTENKPKKYPVLICGNVVSCLLSSASSVSTGERNFYSSQIVSTVYRIKIKAKENDKDKEFIAYSEKFYEKGELVLIKILKRKYAAIIEI